MLPAAFPIYRVTVAHQDRRDEQLGTKAKFWFDRAGSRTLFKRGRANEDWSEKVASECAHLLGLPHAVVELAVCDGLAGILSLSFLDKGDHLVHGNELLLQIDRDYPSGQRYRMPQHTLAAVLGALEKLAPYLLALRRTSRPASMAGTCSAVCYCWTRGSATLTGTTRTGR